MFACSAASAAARQAASEPTAFAMRASTPGSSVFTMKFRQAFAAFSKPSRSALSA